MMIIALVLLLAASPVAAQAPITMAQATVIVPADLTTAVVATLTADQPVDGAAYYAITDYTLKGGVYIVSVVALGGEVDPGAWTIDQAIWLGTVAITDGSWVGAVQGTTDYNSMTAHIFYQPTPDSSFGVSPEGGEDGETYTGPLLPIRAGAMFVYGVRGTHEAGYGATGWYAVDLVSGSDYGGGYAPPEVYGAKQEQVTYVCRDENGVTVKTDSFIYGHLQDNAALEVGYTIYRGVQFGTMIYGTFSGTCGWGSQSANHYHIHWGAPASGGVITIGSRYTVNVSTGLMTGDDNETYQPGDSVLNIGSGTTDPSIDPNKEFTGESFWDGLVGAVIDFINSKIFPRYPTGQAWEAGATFVSTAGTILKVFFILMSSNFRLEVFGFVVILILVLEPIRTIFRVWKVIRKAIPGL